MSDIIGKILKLTKNDTLKWTLETVSDTTPIAVWLGNKTAIDSDRGHFTYYTCRAYLGKENLNLDLERNTRVKFKEWGFFGTRHVTGSAVTYRLTVNLSGEPDIEFKESETVERRMKLTASETLVQNTCGGNTTIGELFGEVEANAQRVKALLLEKFTLALENGSVEPAPEELKP